MNQPDQIVKKAMAALEREPAVNLHDSEIHLQFDDGTMTVSGEVPDVRAKKRALICIASLPEVSGILDRLHIRPAESLGDDAIRAHLLARMSEESSLHGLDISVEVQDGIITLDGSVPSLSHKRLAGVLAWWTRGRRDVINGLEVSPAQEDHAEEIAEAVRLVLEKDPFIDASRIRVGARHSTVSLAGHVANATERDMAEDDAWYTFGVDDVINHLHVL